MCANFKLKSGLVQILDRGIFTPLPLCETKVHRKACEKQDKTIVFIKTLINLIVGIKKCSSWNFLHFVTVFFYLFLYTTTTWYIYFRFGLFSLAVFQEETYAQKSSGNIVLPS